jgi:hypothetical protein
MSPVDVNDGDPRSALAAATTSAENSAMSFRQANLPIRSGFLAVGSALLGLLLMAACGATTPTTVGHDTATQTRLTNGNPPGEVLNPSTIADLLAAIANAGLAAPNPRDVTQRDCPDIGCMTKIDTDTVSIIKFSTTGRAELYAGSTHHVFLIEDVVMTFADSVPTGQRLEYERAVKRAVE